MTREERRWAWWTMCIVFATMVTMGVGLWMGYVIWAK